MKSGDLVKFTYEKCLTDMYVKDYSCNHRFVQDEIGIYINDGKFGCLNILWASTLKICETSTLYVKAYDNSGT